MKCFSCDIDKDLSVLETYSHPEDDRLCDDPLPPLFVLECSGENGFRIAVVCHECFHRLDMWIGQNCWESLNPKIPYAELPLPHPDRRSDEFWQAESYQP